MKLKGEAELQCTTCNQKVKITHLDFEGFKTLLVGSDKGIGPKVTYGSDCTIFCSGCEKVISGTFIYIEYPIGIINHEEFQLGNAATIISKKLSAI